MSVITLVATGHRNKGLCNSDELYQVIERHRPEVIFEEIPQSKFEKVYKGFLADSLETSTIKRYLQKNAIIQVPVDLDITEEAEKRIRRGMNEVFQIIEERCREYSTYQINKLCFRKCTVFAI